MAEERPRKSQDGADDDRVGAGRVLMVIIIPDTAILDDVATMLLEVGVAGTVLDSKGLMMLMREEMPIFGGLASMLPQNTGSKMIFSVTTRELAESALETIEREFKRSERPIALTVGIERLIGVRQ